MKIVINEFSSFDDRKTVQFIQLPNQSNRCNSMNIVTSCSCTIYTPFFIHCYSHIVTLSIALNFGRFSMQIYEQRLRAIVLWLSAIANEFIFKSHSYWFELCNALDPRTFKTDHSQYSSLIVAYSIMLHFLLFRMYCLNLS